MEAANIGSAGIERRLRNSAVAFGLALLLIVLMRLAGAPAWSYGVLVLPFWSSGFLVYQGLFKT